MYGLEVDPGSGQGLHEGFRCTRSSILTFPASFPNAALLGSILGQFARCFRNCRDYLCLWGPMLIKSGPAYTQNNCTVVKMVSRLASDPDFHAPGPGWQYFKQIPSKEPAGQEASEAECPHQNHSLQTTFHKVSAKTSQQIRVSFEVSLEKSTKTSCGSAVKSPIDAKNDNLEPNEFSIECRGSARSSTSSWSAGFQGNGVTTCFSDPGFLCRGQDNGSLNKLFQIK